MHFHPQSNSSFIWLIFWLLFCFAVDSNFLAHALLLVILEKIRRINVLRLRGFTLLQVAAQAAVYIKRKIHVVHTDALAEKLIFQGITGH